MEMCLTIQESKAQSSKLIKEEARKEVLSGSWTSHGEDRTIGIVAITTS